MANIKHENGIVTYRMRTGSNFVKSTMSLAKANAILSNAKETSELFYGGVKEIGADDMYFFPVDNREKKAGTKK